MDSINEKTQAVLADIFENSERPDKIKINLNKTSRSLTVVYVDLDDEWFKELLEADNG